MNKDIQRNIFEYVDPQTRFALKGVNSMFYRNLTIFDYKKALFEFWIKTVDPGNFNRIKSVMRIASSLNLKLNLNIRQRSSGLNLLELAATALDFKILNKLINDNSFILPTTWFSTDLKGAEIYNKIFALPASSNQFKIVDLLLSNNQIGLRYATQHSIWQFNYLLTSHLLMNPTSKGVDDRSFLIHSLLLFPNTEMETIAQYQIVILIIDRRNVPDLEIKKSLCVVIGSLNILLLRFLVNVYKMDINEKIDGVNTPLFVLLNNIHETNYERKIKVMEWMIHHGADINVTGLNGNNIVEKFKTLGLELQGKIMKTLIDILYDLNDEKALKNLTIMHLVSHGYSFYDEFKGNCKVLFDLNWKRYLHCTNITDVVFELRNATMAENEKTGDIVLYKQVYGLKRSVLFNSG